MNNDTQKHIQNRYCAALIDAFIVALCNAAVFSFLCFQILVEQGPRQYTLTTMPNLPALTVNALSICATWLAYCFTDALAVFPCMLSLLISIEMDKISPLVRNFELAFAAAIVNNFLYHLIFEGSMLRATPGKLMYGLTVNIDKKFPTLLSLALRHLAKIISAPAICAAKTTKLALNVIVYLGLDVPFPWLAVIEKIASGDDCRWPHDLISNTSVGRRVSPTLPNA